eukprot:TRINITY_DN715_c0_g1_i1.p1 TRINITY_DN715_c0_g1~~TRINITY_DN715_c0_g1_i1.p1  ORF type:complete len:178 (+),score=29.26 TRINITY_DN715_c0_g1_i1:35-535(+)
MPSQEPVKAVSASSFAAKEQPQMAVGMCANMTCTKKSSKRCARCHVYFYCSRECQIANFKAHKHDCKQWAQLDAQELDLQDQETRMKAHQREFKRIVSQYGLNKGDRADQLADLLTNAVEEVSIPAQKVADQFELPLADASTLLAWIDVGLRFKEQALDASKAAFG